MRVNGRRYLETFIFGIVEGLGYFPVLLLAAAFFLQGKILIWLLGLLFLFFIPFLIRCSLPDKWRALSFLSAAATVAIYSFLFFDSVWAKWITLVIGLVAAYRGNQYAENDREQLVQPLTMWLIGLPLYVAGYILFANNDHLVMYKNWLSIAGFLFICMMVFMSNEQILHDASFSKERQKKVGSEVKRLNRFYLFLILVVIVTISNFQSIQSSIYSLVKSLLTFLLGRKDTGKSAEVTREQPVRPQFHPGKNTPSHMPAWVDHLFWIIGILLAAGFCIVLAVIMIKKFRVFIGRLFAWITNLFARILQPRYQKDLALEYEDEKVSLFDMGKWRGELKDNVQELFQKITTRKPKFEQMAMEEKIRYIYRFLAGEVRQQEKWRVSLTAHEVLQLNERREQLELFKKWYDDLRYGKKLPSESEMKQVDEFWLRVRQ